MELPEYLAGNGSTPQCSPSHHNTPSKRHRRLTSSRTRPRIGQTPANTPTRESYTYSPLNLEEPPPTGQRGFFDNTATRAENSKPNVNVYAPIYPNSQIWIKYEIDPQLVQSAEEDSVWSPPGESPGSNHRSGSDVKYVYFKLIIDGDCIVSWGIGKSGGWRGTTMFGLYPGDTGHYLGSNSTERRGFVMRGNEVKQELELRIYRAKGRRRIGKESPPEPKNNRGIGLVNLGRLESYAPQRHYQYALIDPVDEPYAVFHYHFLSRESLDALGFIRPPHDEPQPGHVPDIMPLQEEQSDDNSSSSYVSAPEEPSVLTQGEASSVSTPELELELEPGQQMSAMVRRLSIPPSIRLVPSALPIDPVSPLPQGLDAEHLEGPVSPLTDMEKDTYICSAQADFGSATSQVEEDHIEESPLRDEFAHADLQCEPLLNLSERNAAQASSTIQKSTLRKEADDASTGKSSIRMTETVKVLKGVFASALRRKNRGESSAKQSEHAVASGPEC